MEFEQILRVPLFDIKMQDVRFINISDQVKPWLVDFVYATPAPWPSYRDWTSEAKHLTLTICKLRITVKLE